MSLTDLDDMAATAPSAELKPMRHRLSPATATAGPADDSSTAGTRWSDSTTALIPGLTLVSICVAVSFTVTAFAPTVSPLVAAVAVGAVLANLGVIPDSARPGLRFAAKRLLRFGVVLLGFKLALGDVLALGGPGLMIVSAVVVATFFGTQWLGRLLGVSPSMSLLVATGFSICGASAIAAVEGVSDADDEEVAFSIGLVTLCGSLAIIVLPLMVSPLSLTAEQFGMFTGASVHDVAQVVATASTQDADAVESAVLVKLTRVILLAPLVAGVTIARRRRSIARANRVTSSGGSVDSTPLRRTPIVPVFVAGFLVAILVRSSGILGMGSLDTVAHVEKLAFVAALVGLGSGVQISKLRQIGARPLLLGAASWVLVAGTALAGVILVGF